MHSKNKLKIVIGGGVIGSIISRLSHKNSFKNYIKFSRYLRIIGISASAVLTVIMTLTVYPVVNETMVAEAAPGTATASTTTLTMSSSFTSAGLKFMAINKNGTFASSDENNSAKFSIKTNNYTGYTLSISSDNDDGKLNNTEANSYLSTIDNAVPDYVFNDNSSTVLNNQWGYRPSKYYNTDTHTTVDNINTNASLFLPSPTRTATILDITDAANALLSSATDVASIDNLIANDYTIGLGARVDYNQPAGSYTGTFILTATANPVSYIIRYSDNTGDTSVTNLPTIQSSATSEARVALPINTPSRTGYTFKSWCLGVVGNDGTTCTGTEYVASTTDTPSYFGIDQTTMNDTTLYAVWTPNKYNITIKTNTGIDKVSLKNIECDSINNANASTTGCAVSDLVYGETYDLISTASTGYTFSVWYNINSAGIIDDINTTYTTFKVGAGDTTLVANAIPNRYDITIKTSPGISKVSLNGIECDSDTYNGASTDGCAIYNLTYGQTYDLIATAASGYTFSSWSNSNGSTSVGTIASSTTASTKYTVGAGTTTLSASATANKYTITIKPTTGVSKVSLNGTECTNTSGCNVANLVYGQTYNLVATVSTGYSFSSWSNSASLGMVTSSTTASTTFKVGAGATTLTASATINKYNITIKTSTGISKVTLNGAECTSTSGCTVSDLTYGESYDLVATASTGYTFSSWTNGNNVGTVASTTTASTKYAVGAGTSTLTASATINKYNITIKTSTGISKVTLNGTECTSTSGCTVKDLTYNSTYNLAATAATGYSFSSWNNSASKGTIASTTTASTTFKVGAGATALTANATANKYTITIKTSTGISKVSLNGTECTTTAGCEVKDLTYGQTYNLTATVATGYSFSSWANSSSNGTITSTTTASTTFKVGAGATTLTASSKVNQYICTKRYRLQNADGSYPSSYTADGTAQVNYGATCTYSKTITNYNGNKAKSTSGTMTEKGITLSIDFPRNTYALTVNKNDIYISAVSGAGTYRWGQSVTIGATVISGYVFAGWSQTSGTTSTFKSATSASTTFTMPKSAATIYANGSVKNISNAGTMQDVVSAADGGCPSTLTTGKAYALTDSRDNQTYYVARLADGNCWMLDNLNLDLTNTTVINSLTASNTNASAKALGYLKNGGGNDSNQWANSGLTKSNWTTGNSYTSPLINKSGTCKTTGGYPCSYNGSYNNNSVISSLASNSKFGQGQGKVGMYYNFCAVSAGSYCYAAGLGTTTGTGYDICPAGWRLPTGGGGGEYQMLCNAINGSGCNSDYTSMNATSTSSFQYQLSTSLTGFYIGEADSLTAAQGDYGRFWSSTRSLYTNASTRTTDVDHFVCMDVYVNKIAPAHCAAYRAHADATRCILDTDSYSKLQKGTMTMQEFGAMSTLSKSKLLAKMVTSQAYTVTDLRDGETYKIAKLPDGKVWMLDNLNLDLTNSTVIDRLHYTNTNATKEAINYLKNGGGTDDNQWANRGLTRSNWTGGDSSMIPMVNISGTCSNTGEFACTYSGSYTHNTVLSTLASNSTFGLGQGKVGVLYNYCAATAGSYCYGGIENTGNAKYDICPSGWRMPTGGAGSGEYWELCRAVTGSACTDYTPIDANNKGSLQYQLSTTLAGDYRDGRAYVQGEHGGFWSSTYASSISVHYLLSMPYGVLTNLDYNRSVGRSIRCIIK